MKVCILTISEQTNYREDANIDIIRMQVQDPARCVAQVRVSVLYSLTTISSPPLLVVKILSLGTIANQQYAKRKLPYSLASDLIFPDMSGFFGGLRVRNLQLLSKYLLPKLPRDILIFLSKRPFYQCTSGLSCKIFFPYQSNFKKIILSVREPTRPITSMWQSSYPSKLDIINIQLTTHHALQFYSKITSGATK